VLICLASLMLIIGISSMAVAMGAASNSAFQQSLTPQNQANASPGSPPPAAPPASFNPQRFIFGMLGMYLLPGLFGLALGGTALWSLLSRETGAWFSFAWRIRDEHRRLRHELG
jgi:hypothetical protein